MGRTTAISLGCWLTRRRLGAYVDGELGPAARRTVASHLARCSACSADLAALERLRAHLARWAVPEPSEEEWTAFWPAVRARLPVSDTRVPAAPAVRWRGWVRAHPRLAFASAVATAAVGVLAFLMPWRVPVQIVDTPQGPGPAAPVPTVASEAPVGQVVVHAVETDDPNSSVMVFRAEEPGVTVVWVFGLEQT